MFQKETEGTVCKLLSLASRSSYASTLVWQVGSPPTQSAVSDNPETHVTTWKRESRITYPSNWISNVCMIRMGWNGMHSKGLLFMFKDEV